MSLPEKPLYFVHITKTGGTSIENAALEFNVTWGMHCELTRERLRKKAEEGAVWHLPLDEWSDEDFAFLKQERRLFTVVRDPMERVVSEYRCEFGNQFGPAITRWGFNRIVLRYLIAVIRNENIAAVGHWVPQHKYVYRKGHQEVKKILSFSRLKSDFENFCQSEELPFVLPHARKGRKDDYSKDHLYWMTKLLVYFVYRKDYLLLRKFF